MKKFIQIVTATILAAGFIGSAAGAQSACTITNVGNGNQVNASCTTVQNVTLTCTNGIFAATYNNQNASTGNATVTGNSSTGSATTGTAVNYNNNTVTIGAACNPGTLTAATPTPTPSATPSATPVTPGKGAVALPNTAANDTASIIAVSLASAAAVVGLSRAGLAVYRRVSNN